MPANPSDSLANVIGDMTVIVDNVAYAIPLHEYLQSLEVESSSDGTWFGKLVMFDAREELEELLTFAGVRARVLIRWGWDGPGGIEALPQYAGRVSRISPCYTPQGTQFELGLVPDVFLAALLDRQVHGWEAGTVISDIVAQIAQLRHFRVKDEKGRSTIQATTTKLPDALSQMGESDLRFIQKYLVPYAVDDQGRGGFQVFMDRDNTLHFHNDYFQPPELAATYTAYRDSMGEVIEFSPDNNAVFAAIMGAGTTVYQGADGDGGVRAEVVTDLYRGVPGVQSTVLEDAGNRVDLGKKTHSRVSLFERDPDLFTARVAHQYAQMARIAYTARLLVRGTHAVRVNDYVACRYYRRNGSPHPLSGNFIVKRIVHAWSQSGWTTDFDLLRDGISDVEGTVRQGAQQQIAVEQTGATQVAGQGPSGNEAVGVEDHPVQPGGESRR